MHSAAVDTEPRFINTYNCLSTPLGVWKGC